MAHKVFVTECNDYDDAQRGVEKILQMMGGIEGLVSEGEKLALKVNLLRKADPAEAVSTHPEIVCAVARSVSKAGASPLIVDSPGAGFKFTRRVLESIYDKNGMAGAAERSGAALNYDTSFKVVSFSEGKFLKRFEIIRAIADADGVINLCKLKSHSFMHMTGAVKNCFGVIPGLMKPGYHAKLRDTDRFAEMLLDLVRLVSPRLSIMDAVVAMEGEGPSTGTPRKTGLILASESPLALDIVAGEMIGLAPDMNPILRAARRRDEPPFSMDHVELIGPGLEDIRISDFRFPDTIDAGIGMYSHLCWWRKILQPTFKGTLSLRPVISRKRCAACGACQRACPVHAISRSEGRGGAVFSIDEKSCIRCYCCHEMCPEGAIDLKGSLMYRITKLRRGFSEKRF